MLLFFTGRLGHPQLRSFWRCWSYARGAIEVDVAFVFIYIYIRWFLRRSVNIRIWESGQEGSKIAAFGCYFVLFLYESMFFALFQGHLKFSSINACVFYDSTWHNPPDTHVVLCSCTVNRRNVGGGVFLSTKNIKIIKHPGFHWFLVSPLNPRWVPI